MIASVSLFVVSVTDVAVITGALFGAAGNVAGGVNTTLVVVGVERFPHAGEHFAPLTVSVQLTPAFAESFVTVAFSVTAVAPALIVEILLVIETEIAGGVFAAIENVTESDFVESATDVAVIVTEFVVGGVAGAVYVTDVVEFALIVPAPVAGAIVQVTPWSAESFVTLALNVTDPLAGTLVVLFVMLTATVCDVVLCPLPLHPNPATTHTKNASAIPILEIPRCIEPLLVSESP